MNPKPCSAPAIAWLVREGLSESPTTATVPERCRRSLISRRSGFACMSLSSSGPDVIRSPRPSTQGPALCPWPRPSRRLPCCQCRREACKSQRAIRARWDRQVLCVVAELDHGPGIQCCSSAHCVPLPSHVPSYRTMWTDSLMFSRVSHALDSCWQADQEAKRYVEQTREEADPKPYNQSGPIRLRIGSRAVTRRPYPKGEPPNHYGPCRLRHSHPLAYDHENAPAREPGQDP